MNDQSKKTKQFFITTAAGKRLIGRSIIAQESIKSAMENNTVVILGGTTNGYVAEEALKSIGQIEGFSRDCFFRGVTFPPGYSRQNKGGKDTFVGDIVIRNNQWEKGKTIFDVADDLKQGDIILKGANAFNPVSKQIGLLIGHPKAGTILPILQAVHGQRVRLIIPVGLEKRIHTDLTAISTKMNHPQSSGVRYFTFAGEIHSEIEAIKELIGAEAELIASGGVAGAEGGYWLAVTGDRGQLELLEKLFDEIRQEPNFMP